MAFRILNTRLEWVPEGDRPSEGDLLLIPANDHLWMLSGPGLELKKSLGKELELEAVRQGPVEPGAVVATAGPVEGHRLLLHAAVMGQDLRWLEGAGKAAARAACAVAAREKASVLTAYPFYRGAHGRPEEPAREMLAGFLEALEEGSPLRTVSILYGRPDERLLLHETFLRLLSAPR